MSLLCCHPTTHRLRTLQTPRPVATSHGMQAAPPELCAQLLYRDPEGERHGPGPARPHARPLTKGGPVSYVQRMLPSWLSMPAMLPSSSPTSSKPGALREERKRRQKSACEPALADQGCHTHPLVRMMGLHAACVQQRASAAASRQEGRSAKRPCMRARASALTRWAAAPDRAP